MRGWRGRQAWPTGKCHATAIRGRGACHRSTRRSTGGWTRPPHAPAAGTVLQAVPSRSARTWHPRWGRRRPFITAGALLCAVILFVFPFVGVLWLGVICFWLLDIGNNTSMEPYRAFISDRLAKSQLARGFLTQSMARINRVAYRHRFGERRWC